MFGRDANADILPSTIRNYGNMWHYFHRRQVGKPGQPRRMQLGRRCGPLSGDRWRAGRSRVRRRRGWLGVGEGDVGPRYIGRVEERASAYVRLVTYTLFLVTKAFLPLSVYFVFLSFALPPSSSSSPPPNELSLVCGFSSLVNFSRHRA